jgi:hypothetical protein
LPFPDEHSITDRKQLKKSEKYYGIDLRLSSKEPGPVLLFFLDPIGLAGYCLITRKKLVPQFFPEGRLAAKSGTIKISILRRIRVLFGTGTGMPMLILVGTLSLIIWELDDSVISASAKEILTSCFNSLNLFLESAVPEDDITLVVIKVTED